MKIAIASDHGGALLKTHLQKWLLELRYSYIDFGPEQEGSVDYPYYATRVARAIQKEGFDLGILICTTGTGMCIAANRFSGIRAANCTEEYMAKMAREHNHANVLCLGQNVVAFAAAERILKAFLETSFSSEIRHNNRVEMIDGLSKIPHSAL